MSFFLSVYYKFVKSFEIARILVCNVHKSAHLYTCFETIDLLQFFAVFHTRCKVINRATTNAKD